jgi:hypothetical protein
MKKFLFGCTKKGEGKRKTDPLEDDAKGKEDTFLEETDCLMIFGGPTTYNSKR